jgi:hypothetical protein
VDYRVTNFAPEATLSTCIREIVGSNIGLHIGYPHCGYFIVSPLYSNRVAGTRLGLEHGPLIITTHLSPLSSNATLYEVVRKIRFPMIFHNEKHVYWH